ncbi:MAG: hypothetical protein AVDCRST_MAG50-1567, partial [uncultured Acidimicrobiales bacterium]
ACSIRAQRRLRDRGPARVVRGRSAPRRRGGGRETATRRVLPSAGESAHHRPLPSTRRSVRGREPGHRLRHRPRRRGDRVCGGRGGVRRCRGARPPRRRAPCRRPSDQLLLPRLGAGAQRRCGGGRHGGRHERGASALRSSVRRHLSRPHAPARRSCLSRAGAQVASPGSGSGSGGGRARRRGRPRSRARAGVRPREPEAARGSTDPDGAARTGPHRRRGGRRPRRL